MYQPLRGFAGALLLLCAHALRAQTPDAAELFAHFRQASGGEAWEAVTVLVAEGEGKIGGMSGAVSSVENLRDGRFRTEYALGPAVGGDGFDGQRIWTMQGRGEIDEVTDPPQLERTRTQIWMTRQGFWADELLGARLGAVRLIDDAEGARYGVEVTPPEGSPIELVFDHASGLLVQTRAQEGLDLVVVSYQDFRRSEGVVLPFRQVVDRGDPRNQLTLQWARYAPAEQPTNVAFDAPETGPADFHFVDNQPVEIDFQLINNHIYLTAEVNGKPHLMLFDTGGINLLSPGASERLGLQSEGQMAVRGVGEKRQDLGMTRANSLRVGGFELIDPVLMVIDIELMQPVEGVKIEGLLGFEVFKRAVVRIDYPGRKITLYPPNQAPALKGTVLPFTLRGRTPVVEGEIDGIPARLTVDTGSRGAVSFHAPFAREKQLLERYRPRFQAVNGWGSGGPVYSHPVAVGELKIGEQTLHDLVGDIFTGDKGAFASPDSDANIGSGTLKAFVVTFDYANRRISLERSNDYEADGYERLGMWFNQSARGPYLEVMAVTPGAPAEQAGIKAGDLLSAVDGIAVSEKSLSDWRAWSRQLPLERPLIMTLGDGSERRLITANLLPD